MKVRDFLKIKERKPIIIGPEETVLMAIKKLVENNIGALPVCNEEGRIVGIISERDVLQECLKESSIIDTVKVEDIMTRYVAVATPDEDLDYATSVMKQKGIRHLPVVVDSRVEGMISMRDIVNTRLKELETEIRYDGLLHHHNQRRII
ncbi:CBS domain-containing protein [Chloroflexota bacterium]